MWIRQLCKKGTYTPGLPSTPPRRHPRRIPPSQSHRMTKACLLSNCVGSRYFWNVCVMVITYHAVETKGWCTSIVSHETLDRARACISLRNSNLSSPPRVLFILRLGRSFHCLWIASCNHGTALDNRWLRAHKPQTQRMTANRQTGLSFSQS